LKSCHHGLSIGGAGATVVFGGDLSNLSIALWASAMAATLL